MSAVVHTAEQRRFTARQSGRVAAIALTLFALSLSGLEADGAVNVLCGTVSTLAFVIATGFVALDVSGALPESLNTRPYMWALIIPVSLGINVITGTVLAAFGPGISSWWFWGITAGLVVIAESAHGIRRRLA